MSPGLSVRHVSTAAEPGRPAAHLRVGLVGPLPPKYGGAVPGGVATHQLHLATALHEAGVRVSLLATNAAASDPESWRDPALPFDTYRSYVPGGLAGFLNPRYLRPVGAATMARYAAHLLRHRVEGVGSRRVALGNLLWYRRFVTAARPSVLHVQHPMERQVYARLLRDLGDAPMPLVVTVHSLFEEHAEEVIRDLMAPNLRRADRLIAVAPHVAQQAIELGANPDTIRVIRSGVDAERYRPRDRQRTRQTLGLSSEPAVILFVGNLESRKAVDRLLVAFDRVRRDVSSPMLAIVGTGATIPSDNQEPRLKAMVAELGLGEVVRFLGRLPDQALLDWYAAADVFALPSRSEGQGIVALEAMAAGLPVVVSAVGGLVGTVDDGRTGYMVPFGDTDLFAARLSTLLQDVHLRQRLGAAARESVLRDFSWQRAAMLTADVYREVLER